MMSGALQPRETRNLGDRFIEWTEHETTVHRERMRSQTAQRTAEIARLKSDVLPRPLERQSAPEPEQRVNKVIPAGSGIQVNMPSRHQIPSPSLPQELASESLIPPS